MIKRLFDIIFSITALLLLSPVFLVISILIFMTDGKPIYFTQKRSGINKQSFEFYKFRTMTNEKDKNGDLLPDEKRLSKYGRILRKTSIDEFPSFFNVLKGDMSVVGPRPLLERYLSRYDNNQIRRLEVKPGITGLAQIKGRNNLSWEEKFEFDVNYVDNYKLLIDIKIILLTFLQLFRPHGINTKNETIMPEFMGKGKK
jgi:lipopolysaccharide/colanic/teichoic acid biosynthesis glycosyltransferase